MHVKTCIHTLDFNRSQPNAICHAECNAPKQTYIHTHAHTHTRIQIICPQSAQHRQQQCYDVRSLPQLCACFRCSWKMHCCHRSVWRWINAGRPAQIAGAPNTVPCYRVTSVTKLWTTLLAGTYRPTGLRSHSLRLMGNNGRLATMGSRMLTGL